MPASNPSPSASHETIGCASVRLTITNADNNKTLCVTTGTIITVFLHGTLSDKWASIRSDSIAVTSRVDPAMTLQASVTGAAFDAASPGTATISSARPPTNFRVILDIQTRLCGGGHDLGVRIVPGQDGGAVGNTYYTLQLTNTGSDTCSLSGYPAVSAITRAGRQLGSPAGHGLMTVDPRVTLAPGATAHTTLVYHGGLVSAGGGCGPVEKAFELRVGMAGQKFPAYAAFGSRSCSRAGHVYLTITESIRAGAGTTGG
jgi:hypothetical protein